MFKNWKTTVGGILAIAVTAAHFLGIAIPNVTELIGGLGVGGALLAAADAKKE